MQHGRKMCDLVTNNSKHLRSSRGAFNDPRSFYSTIYSTSYNKDKDISSIDVNPQYKTGYVTNIKPFVSLAPNWNLNSESFRKFHSDQFVTVTDRDYKPFKFPNGRETTPQYVLKSDTGRYGKERVLTTPRSDQICSEAAAPCNKSSEQADAFRVRHANPYSQRDLFLSNIVPNKSSGVLGAQVYQLCDPKMKLQSWSNQPVTFEAYVDPVLYKSISHNPKVSEKAERITGITLRKPLTGEDWYPFDRNIEKRASDAGTTKNLGSISKLDEYIFKRDPCRIINDKYPRLVSIQKADYSKPDLNYDRTQRSMLDHNKNCMPSAYARVDKSEVLPFTSRVIAASFATETSNEFGNQSSTNLGNKGYFDNFSRVGLKDTRIMHQEEIKT
uniref:Uncharacterized protein n=1 Tax=Strigamia maritima TaxID=126957 RepID=T1JCI8_STRMM